MCEHELSVAEQERYRRTARELYADPSNDDIEIDDDCEFSDARPDSPGVWVQAWVWVHQEDVECTCTEGETCAICTEAGAA